MADSAPEPAAVPADPAEPAAPTDPAETAEPAGGEDEEEVPPKSEEERLREEKEALEKELDESRKAVSELEEKVNTLTLKSDAGWVLDVAVGECEFASSFAYYLELQLDGYAEKWRTDVSQPSERPVFAESTCLLPVNKDLVKERLKVSAFVNVVDPSAPDAAPTPKLLGSALLPLSDLKVEENATASRPVMRNANFTRMTSEGGAEGGKNLMVGRATLSMQVKALNSSEAAARSAALQGRTPRTEAMASAPSLDKSLWPVRPFEHRLRVLAHRADALPVPEESAHATVRLAVRLMQPGGLVLNEVATASLSIEQKLAGTPGSSVNGEVAFNTEIVLALPALSEENAGLQIGMALEMVSVGPGGSATTDSLLDLHWKPGSLPLLSPLHLYARTSASASTVPSFARPRPNLLVSISREPSHDALDGLADGNSHGTEIRVHGVSAGRPLPDAVDGAIVAVCPESSGLGPESSELRIPVATYFYDQRIDLSTFMEAHFRGASAAELKCFLTPLASLSRAPQWGQFVLRFLTSPAALKRLPLLVFEHGGARADPDSPLGGSLLGFASLDADALIGSAVTARSFLLDLRLLEAPGASTSLEVEARIWPRGGGKAVNETKASETAAKTAGGTATLLPSGAAADTGTVTAALNKEANDFRLNHELQVQLAKEFNMRAAALKRAGEEIVALRRQVQLLKNENSSLKLQIEDEEKLAEDVRQKPPPEGLDSLSSAELAAKLQRTLEKYREEKAKGSELGRRLEEAIKEAGRGRALERSLDELQQAHLEQNRELQRLQEEGKKLDTYRQTTKTQEKVISKLEKILESSLQEVQKAQKVQVDVERLKTENLKLRERCSSLLVARRKPDAGEQEDELRRKLSQKDAEVARLQAVAQNLRTAGGEADARGGETNSDQQRLNDIEAKRLDWEQRAQAAEHRLQMLQQQLTESSKRYGADISDCQVEIAKKDARILELEFLLKKKEEG